MSKHSRDHSRSGFSLSNMQVMAILLVAGTLLVGVTFVFAKDIGRIPVSLWDICTTPAATQEAPATSPPPTGVSRN
ncbi:hypothetical protein [Herbaspirillum sp. NPDC101397]|uniref:hypothetical protein n=1 Tax=Herbaspirillum sp. NPDC101397 TaxID=3364006 RepID=UPI003839DA6B